MAEEATSTQEEPGYFGSDEILWYKVGRWGDENFAIPNTGGKNWCINPFVWEFTMAVGAELFEIMNREDRRFQSPLDIGLAQDIVNLVQIAKKRLADNALLPGEPIERSEHYSPGRKEFVLFPVPFFDDAIRCSDLRNIAYWTMVSLCEAYQHNEADRSVSITAKGFAASIWKHLRKPLVLVATKYLGFTRDQAIADTFEVKADDWKKWDNTKWLMSHETSVERADIGAIPTENDLRAIRGVKASVAMLLARRYPTGEKVFLGGGDGTQPASTETTVSTAAVNPEVAAAMNSPR